MPAVIIINIALPYLPFLVGMLLFIGAWMILKGILKVRQALLG